MTRHWAQGGEQFTARSGESADRARVQELIDFFPSPSTALRADGRDTVANPAYIALFGLDSESPLLSLNEIVHPDDIDAAWAVFKDCPPDRPRRPVEVRLRHASGSYIRCSWVARLDSELGWFIVSGMDITARHDRQTALLTEARTDALTGVANRAGLLEALGAAVAAGEPHHVAIIDLDRFKVVNDTFGHAAGDEVLKVVAARLSSNAPDDAIVSRTGGDEFVILTTDNLATDNLATDNGESLDDFGQRLAALMSEPIVLGTRTVSISGSVGIASTRTDGTSDLMQEADFAVYEAKRRTTAPWAVADPALVERGRRALDLEQRLHAGIANQAFKPWFQPIVRVATGEPIAYETLMRWPNSSGAPLHAGEFIDIANVTGLIAAMGRQIVPETLEFIANTGGMPVSVNLSPAELADESWLHDFVDQVHLSGVDHSQIYFEVTESSVIADLAAACERLDYLRNLGFGITLDDFGAGYSSLTYLTALPVQTVKLDQALLGSSRRGERSDEIFEAVVRFVRDLDYGMVVEGVETQEDHDYLLSLGVDYAQGWFYGRAQPAEIVLAQRSESLPVMGS